MSIKRSIIIYIIILTLLAGCGKIVPTTVGTPTVTSRIRKATSTIHFVPNPPTRTPTPLIGYIIPTYQDRCPANPETNLAEIGITKSDVLVIYDGKRDYNTEGISTYSLLDGIITHIPGTELHSDWDEQWFIPGPGDDSVTLYRKNWDQDISKIWIISLKTMTMKELLSDKAAYRHFEWISDHQLLITGITDENTEGAKFWQNYPISLVDITKNTHHEYPKLTDFVGYFDTNLRVYLDGDHLFDIYYDYINYHDKGQLYLFDYSSKKITPILTWLTAEEEFHDPSYLLTHMSIDIDTSAGKFDIINTHRPYGFDYAWGLPISQLTGNGEYETLMNRVYLRYKGEYATYAMRSIGNRQFLGSFSGDQHLRFTYNSNENAAYIYCEKASMTGNDFITHDRTYIVTSRFVSPVMQVEPDETIILNLETGFYTHIKPFNVLTWVSIE